MWLRYGINGNTCIVKIYIVGNYNIGLYRTKTNKGTIVHERIGILIITNFY